MSNTQQSSAPSIIDHLNHGELISSPHTYYKVQSTLAEGSFGKLVKCSRMDDWTTVLIKIHRRGIKYSRRAQNEVLCLPRVTSFPVFMWLKIERVHPQIAVLSKLRQLNVDMCNIAALETSFVCEGHYCLEFELLDKSLYDLLKEQSFQPLFHMEIRIIVQQVCAQLSGSIGQPLITNH